MRVNILSIGKWKDQALATVFNSYAARLKPAIELQELLPKTEGDKAAEAELILKHWPKAGSVILCDETGQHFNSRALATKLQTLMTANGPALSFIIGGAAGLCPSLQPKASLILSLSQLTLPHLLVRVVLAEQIYRTHTILAGHPYHKD